MADHRARDSTATLPQRPNEGREAGQLTEYTEESDCGEYAVVHPAGTAPPGAPPHYAPTVSLSSFKVSCKATLASEKSMCALSASNSGFRTPA